MKEEGREGEKRESSIMVGSDLEINETFNKVFVFSRKLPELKFCSLK